MLHLMIENPGSYVEKFAKMGIKIIYIRPESECVIRQEHYSPL